MPRSFASARIQEKWTQIIKNYEVSDQLVTFRLIIGDKDFSKSFDTGTLSVDIGALPWTLSVNLSERLPVQYLNAPVRLYAEMAGDRLLLFRGEASYPMPSAEWTVQLTALTPGHYMENATLDEPVEINGETPATAIRNTLSRVPYEKSFIDVYPWDGPLIYRLRNAALPADDTPGSWAGGFERMDSPKAILDSILSEVQGLSIDHPAGGNTTVPDPGVGEGRPISWTYEASSNEIIEPFVSPAWATGDEQITSVVVQDILESGADRIPPQEWMVDYSGMPYPPRVGRTLYIDLSDQTAQAEEEARNLAVKSARVAGRGLWNGSTTAAFNPFHLPLDVITVGHNYVDSTGRFRRLWRCLLTAVNHSFGMEALSTDLGYQAVLLQNQRIPDPPIVLAGVTAGNVHVAGPMWEQAADGRWLLHEENFVGVGTNWAQVQSDGRVLVDTGLAPFGMWTEVAPGKWLLNPENFD